MGRCQPMLRHIKKTLALSLHNACFEEGILLSTAAVDNMATPTNSAAKSLHVTAVEPHLSSEGHPLPPPSLPHTNDPTCCRLQTEWHHIAAGFMSNRGRQNVASYLVLDMGVDWRLGGDWFESVLQDYDVCSNWGNWVSAAGFTGGRINHFNITKQSKVSCFRLVVLVWMYRLL